MARGGGSTEAGVIYHVISRFVAKEWFIESAIERRTYLGLLGTAIATTNWICFSYAVMSSHIHLGLIAGTDTMASWMRPMHTLFANWLNLRRERIGAVFVKGPNVITVPPNDCARLIHYHHNNPVRAGLVARPADSDWTSHRAYVGAARKPRWLDVSAGLALGDFANREDFAQWCDEVHVSRRELAASGVLPRRRGRPSVGTDRRVGAQPQKGETRLSRRRVSFVAGARLRVQTPGNVSGFRSHDLGDPLLDECDFAFLDWLVEMTINDQFPHPPLALVVLENAV